MFELSKTDVFGKTPPCTGQISTMDLASTPGKPWRCAAFVPQLGEIERLPRGGGRLQDHSSAMAHHLGRNVYDLPPQRGGICL